MLQSRLEAMESDARRVLRAASVFGQVFWEEGVTELLGGSRERADVARWLDELAAREVVHSPSPRQIRSSLGARVSPRAGARCGLRDADGRRQKLGHLLAAKFLESAGETDAMTIAEHLERGGDLPKSVEAFARAAEQALEGNDLGAAIARAERGVRSGAEGRVLGALRRIQTDAHLWRGRSSKPNARVSRRSRCSSAGRVVGRRGRCDGGRFRTSRPRGEHREPKRSAARSAALRQGRRGLCPRRWRAAIGLIGAGRTELASELLAAAEAALVDEPGQAARASVQRARAFSALEQGRATECLDRCLDAVRAFDEVGDVRSACLTRANAGFSLIEVGAHVEAEHMLSEASVAAERMGLGHTLAGIRQNLGRALSLLGRFTDARRVLGEAIAAFDKHGDRRMSGASRAYLAKASCDAGELDAAEREARAAILSLEQAPALRAFACGVLGRPWWARGGRRKRSCTLEKRWTSSRRTTPGRRRDLAASGPREALHAVGDADAARNALALVRERLLDRASASFERTGGRASSRTFPRDARTLELAKAWIPGQPDPLPP